MCVLHVPVTQCRMFIIQITVKSEKEEESMLHVW